jgi:hypothetical protein
MSALYLSTILARSELILAGRVFALLNFSYAYQYLDRLFQIYAKLKYDFRSKHAKFDKFNKLVLHWADKHDYIAIVALLLLTNSKS